MGPWRARLFGPGAAPAGSEVELALEGDAVVVRMHGAAPRRVALAALRLSRTGFNLGRLELAWQDAEGAWACHLDSAADIAALLEHWPREVLPLPRAVLGARRRALMPWAAVALAIALPVLLLGALIGSQERVVDFIAARISPAIERQIGAMTIAQIKASTPFIEDGAEAEALRYVARQLVDAGDDRYRFHLADDELVNAFAVPGGDIVVHRGLLRATRSADELAGVLAHEIQHVALRHSLKGMIRSAGLSVMVSLVVGDPDVALAGRMADQLLTLKFSRDAEREADDKGFSLLIERGIDAKGMVDFFATLAKQQDKAPPALLSTHPASAERQAALAARLQSVPAGCCKSIDTGNAWPPR